MLSLSILQVLSKSPPVKPPEQVADQAEPHECKQKSTQYYRKYQQPSPLYVFLSNLCSFFIFQIHHVVARIT